MPEPRRMTKTLEEILEDLRARGVQAHALPCAELGGAAVKVICVPAGLQESLTALGESSRDQVVMVRVDSQTVRKLDAWVETGAVRSRSEAAALFMREGLGVRDPELSELEAALEEVSKAKERLRERAEEVLGTGSGD